MKKSKKPFSWIVEEHAFGAVALRDEIKRHKAEDEEHWSIFKGVGIRLLYACAMVVTVLLVGIGIVGQALQRFKH